MSVFKDTRTLATQVVDMVDALMANKSAPVNDTKTYNNGVKVVPSFLCQPVFADKSNYKSILVDSGYYKDASSSKGSPRTKAGPRDDRHPRAGFFSSQKEPAILEARQLLESP